MKVILLKPVRKLGKIGDVVTVKDGFGRNFLIPQNIALRATSENIKFFDSKKQEFEEKNIHLHKEASEIANFFEGRDFTFIRQSSSDDRLFGSVSPKEIATELAKLNSTIKYSNILLDTPIKTIGIFEVTLLLYSDITAKIIVNVAKTELAASEALKNYKSESNPESSEETL